MLNWTPALYFGLLLSNHVQLILDAAHDTALRILSAKFPKYKVDWGGATQVCKLAYDDYLLETLRDTNNRYKKRAIENGSPSPVFFVYVLFSEYMFFYGNGGISGCPVA